MSTELHLNIAAFYQQYDATLKAYGQSKQHWWNQPNRKRISIKKKQIDNYSIEQILLSLQNYDTSNGFTRFFRRLFTPIEKQRSLLCYWAIKQLKPLTTRQSTDPNKPLETATLFAILRIHAPRIKSAILWQPLTYWNLALQTITPLFTAWTQLKHWWNPQSLDKSTLKLNHTVEQLKPTAVLPAATLSKSFETAAQALREIYINSQLSSTKKTQAIEKIKIALATTYTKLLQESVVSQQTAIQTAYHAGFAALDAEAHEYNDHLQNPDTYLASLSTHFAVKNNLPAEKQWNRCHKAELQHRYNIAKNLLAQADGTKDYYAIKEKTYHWLKPYTEKLIQHYANHLNNDYNELIAEENPIDQQKTLYQQIEYELKQFDLLLQPLPNWAQKWQNSKKHILKFQVVKNSMQQNGWNCFDIATGIQRKDLVQYALEHAEDREFIKLLAPEIRYAAGVDSSAAEKFALPKKMRTAKFKKIIETYMNATDCEKFKEAYIVCCDAIGRTEGNRPNIDELLTFFEDATNRNTHSFAYTIFNQAYQQTIIPAVENFENYCMDINTYKTYIEEYYAKQGWVAFQTDNTTSMVDIAARMLDKVIIIYKPESLNGKLHWEELYRTTNISSKNQITHIQFNRGHFEQLLPNTKYLMANTVIAQHRKQVADTTVTDKQIPTLAP